MERVLCGLALALLFQDSTEAPSYYSEQDQDDWTDDTYDDVFDYFNLTTFNFNDTESTYNETMAYYNETTGDFDPWEPDYDMPYDYYDSLGSFGLCTDAADVLRASDVVQILSSKSPPSSNEKDLHHWTIAPHNQGGAVTVAKRGDLMSPNLYQVGCEDFHIFQSERNSTTLRTEWCHEKRLLSCDSTMQIAYQIGYTPTSDPGRAVDVVQFLTDEAYDGKEDGGDFSMYYYECGGKRFRGDIRSPIFPKEAVPYKGGVTCRWELHVGRSADYGILRFSGFHLPSCKNHRLIIEEDTVINEEDVTESILKRLQGQEHREEATEESQQPSGDGEYDFEYETIPTVTQVQEVQNRSVDIPEGNEDEYLYVYRDGKISKREAEKNPRAGIHVVAIKKYCGNFHPKRTLSWRRGSKNVTLIFDSDNFTLRDYGFTAKFSAFSWLETMRRHRKNTMQKFRREPEAIPHVIFNYIILIIFVPIGLTVGLVVIVFHIKKRGPTLRDFYRRERREMKLRRSKTERVKAVCPRVHRPTRRAKSLDFPQPAAKFSGITEKPNPERTPGRKRRGSLMNVKFLITGKKSPVHLKTVIEEENSTSRRSSRTSEPVSKTRTRPDGVS